MIQLYHCVSARSFRPLWMLVELGLTYALRLAQHLGLDARFTPAVAAYLARMQARPAFQRALQVQQAQARLQGVSAVPAPDLRA